MTPIRRLFRRLIARRFFRQPGVKQLVEFRGAVFMADKQNKIEAKLLRGDYDPVNLDFCRQVVRPGDVCLDVGANIGVYAVLLSRLVGSEGSVHAFEPVEHARRRLARHLVLNGARNVTVNGIGLGDTDGELVMNQVKAEVYRGGVSSFVDNENIERLGHERFERIEVPVLRLDTYVERASLDRVDFVKIDIEGFELNFLLGARRTLAELRPVLLMEHNQDRLRHLAIDEARFRDLARAVDYEFFELRGGEGDADLTPFDFDRPLATKNIIGLPRPTQT